MTTTVALHSFRTGVGRTLLAANLAALLALDGRRVGVIDFGSEQFGVPSLFGIDPRTLAERLRSYFWSHVPIQETVVDVTDQLGPASTGQLFVVPAVLWREWLSPPVPQGSEPGVFQSALKEITDSLGFDWLVVDAGSGLGEAALLSIATADILIEMARPDAQDLQATATMLGLAEKLDVQRIFLVVSQVPATSNPAKVRRDFEAAYDVPVATVLPIAPELAAWNRSGLLAVTHPSHPWSIGVRRMLRSLKVGVSAARRLGTGEWTMP